MKRILLLTILGCVLHSCIPLRIAPNIKDYKVVDGKKFRKGLPQKTLFVFEDPKNDGDFYNYINTKFQLDDYYVDIEGPFELDGGTFNFSFYEVAIEDKTLNLVPLAVDVFVSAAVGDDEVGTYVANEENTLARKGNWYIAIEVFSDGTKDCLHETNGSRDVVLTYLRELKKEYLATHNYNELVLKN